MAELLADLGADVPGPAGLAVLASVDRSRLSGPELVLLLAALGRAQSWLSSVTESAVLAVNTRSQADADEVTRDLIGRGVPRSRGVEVHDAGREEIALALRVSTRTAGSRLNDARRLRDAVRHPGLADLVEQGLTSPAHARAVVNAVENDTDEVAAATVAHSRVQRRLLAGVPFQAGAAAVGVAAKLRDPVTAEDAHAAAREARGVTSRVMPHGMGQVIADLPAEDMAALMARLQQAVLAARTAGDARTADQVRADTLAAIGWLGTNDGCAHADGDGQLPITIVPDPAPSPAPAPAATDATGPADAAAAELPVPATDDAAYASNTDVTARRAAGIAAQRRHFNRGVKAPPAPPVPRVWTESAVQRAREAWDGRVTANVQVTIGIDTLLALADDPCNLHSYGPVTAQTARALLARPGTTWQRFTHDTNGTLLGVTRAHQAPADLQRLAAHRYTRCTMPGCNRAHGTTTQLDHIQPWAGDQGRALTHAGNVHDLDPRHHQLKTHFGWTSTVDPDTAHITWTSPHGQTATTEPDDWRPIHPETPQAEEPEPPF